MEQGSDLGADTRQTRLSTSYVVLDLDPAGLANLYMRLYFTENVIHCDVTDGAVPDFPLERNGGWPRPAR